MTNEKALEQPEYVVLTLDEFLGTRGVPAAYIRDTLVGPDNDAVVVVSTPAGSEFINTFFYGSDANKHIAVEAITRESLLQDLADAVRDVILTCDTYDGFARAIEAAYEEFEYKLTHLVVGQ